MSNSSKRPADFPEVVRLGHIRYYLDRQIVLYILNISLSKSDESAGTSLLLDTGLTLKVSSKLPIPCQYGDPAAKMQLLKQITFSELSGRKYFHRFSKLTAMNSLLSVI